MYIGIGKGEVEKLNVATALKGKFLVINFKFDEYVIDISKIDSLYYRKDEEDEREIFPDGVKNIVYNDSISIDFADNDLIIDFPNSRELDEQERNLIFQLYKKIKVYWATWKEKYEGFDLESLPVEIAK